MSGAKHVGLLHTSRALCMFSVGYDSCLVPHAKICHIPRDFVTGQTGESLRPEKNRNDDEKALLPKACLIFTAIINPMEVFC